MEERVFTFLGLVGSHEQFFMVASHMLLSALIVLVLVRLGTRSMALIPSGVQNILEWYLEATISMGADVMGEEKAKKYLPLVGTLGLWIFVSNMLGIIPGFESPTANINFTLTLALFVFFYYNFEGIREKGFFTYFGHFMGPIKILAPLMFPVEIISHLSRVISLSFRLFGNIKGDDLFLIVLLLLVPWYVAPILPFILLFFFGILQTFIFMILTYVYLGGAVSADEH
ncbi:MAG: F0F1 ATP synthase subunit A [Helicobacteraceae bacterium]